MPTEKAMAPHSSIVAWKITWMEEPGGLQSVGSLRIGNDWATSLSFFTFMHWRRKWQPTSVFLPGESHVWRSMVGYSPWGRWVGDDWATSLSRFTFMHWRRKWQPTPVFLSGESQGRRSLVSSIYGVPESRKRLKQFSSSISKLCIYLSVQLDDLIYYIYYKIFTLLI